MSLRTLRALTLSGLLAVPLGGQAPIPLQQASRLIGTGKAAEAIPILDSVTAASPNLPRAWAMLGGALLSARVLDRAMVALERAETFPATRATAQYNLGLTLGLLGNLDSAFVRLHQAKASNQVDLTALLTDSTAGPILADPRHRNLLPTAAEYAAPFLEPVRILHQWHGDAPGDQFGWIARDVGDVDGDGVHDIVTSAPTAGANAGAVSLLSTRKGTRLWTVKGTAGDQLGIGIEAAGDVNKDGVPDVLAGAPGGNYALVLSGRDGRVLRRIPARQAGEAFGQRVSDIGDVDGDGHADLLIGAPLNDAKGVDAGRVYLVSGKTGKDLLALTGEAAGHQFGQALAGRVQQGRALITVGAPGVPGGGRSYIFRGHSTAPAFVMEADSTGVSYGGMFATILDDQNGDGIDDVYSSDWSNGALGSTTGRSYVHSGATGQLLRVLTGEGPGNGFGIGAADAGDIDRDGVEDLVIGAWLFSGAAPSGGKVYLYSGKSGKVLGMLTGRVMGETLGFDATGLGDVDGDGVPDLLLTSAWSAIHGARSGRVLVVSGADVMAYHPPDSTLAGLSRLVGLWGPATLAPGQRGQPIVHDYSWTVGSKALRIREGYLLGHTEDAQLDGMVYWNPSTETIQFVAVAGKGEGQGRFFTGEYRVLADSTVERTYDVYYRTLVDTPGEQLGGSRRRYREVYRWVTPDSVHATLEWWRDGRWQPFGPGTYDVVRVRPPQ